MSVGQLSRFLVIAALLFLSLTIAWSILGNAYGAFFRAMGNALLTDTPERNITFVRLDEDRYFHDTEFVMADIPSRTRGKTAISSRRHGYMPTALVLAMFLATPLPWRSRILALTWGLAMVNLYIIAKLALLPIAYDPRNLHSTAAGIEATNSLASKLLWVLSASSLGWAIVPVLIYAFLILRSAGNRRILAGQ